VRPGVVVSGGLPFAAPAARQRSEQKRTLSQSRAHLRRQLNGRPHAAHVLSGRSPFAATGPLAVRRPISAAPRLR
jgi:hypothetical protein